MTDRFESEILLEEPGAEETDRVGVAGVLVGLVLAAVILFVLLVGGRAAADWISGLTGLTGGADETAEVVPGATVEIDVDAGSSARQIGSLLVQSGVIESSAAFESAVRGRGVANQLKAGGYVLVTGAEIDEIIDVLIDGPNITTFRVTVVEGRRIGEVIADVAGQTSFTESDFTAALLDGSVDSIYLPDDVGGIVDWEGLLFPDTYEFFGDATPPEILQRMANEMERRVGQLSWQSFIDDGYTIYEGLIIASIIESEAAVDGDRPLIASVIFNRLEREMMLQIDATVLYAADERRTGLTFDDLEIDSPYNTYIVQGLPPTPIGAPGFKALESVTAPSETEFLYYVLTSDDGSHTFTASYDDFLIAKDQAKRDGIIP